MVLVITMMMMMMMMMLLMMMTTTAMMMMTTMVMMMMMRMIEMLEMVIFVPSFPSPLFRECFIALLVVVAGLCSSSCVCFCLRCCGCS